MPKSNELPELNGPAKPALTQRNDKEIKPAVFLDYPESQNFQATQENPYSAAQTYPPLETENISATQKLVQFFNWEFLNKILINLSRFLLAGLLAFESLNASGVLKNPINNFHWIALVITTVGAWFLLEAIFFYTRENSNQAVSNALMLAAVAALYADTLGQVFKFFDRIEWYDQVLHFFAGGALCASIIFLLIQSLGVRGKINLGILTTAFFAWTTTLSLSLFYEFGELTLDKITGSNSLVSLSDTMNDLLLDTLGSLSILVILVIYFYYVSRRSHAADKNPAPEAANT